jgi:DNA-binding CsgD family transcriptional regulator
MSYLHDLAGKIATTRSEHQLAALLMDDCPRLFEAHCVGVFVFDETAPKMDITGAPDLFIDQYDRYLRANDPLLKCLVEQHRAIRDLDVTTREHWLTNPLYTDIAVPFGMVRCMQAPIVGDGRVTGAINVARRQDAAFSAEDLMNLSSVGAHVSVQLARLTSMPLALQRLRSVLTEREVEVSLLVAKGLTNEQVGHVLGVSANAIKGSLGRAFRKLGIESRVELVATLFDGL